MCNFEIRRNIIEHIDRLMGLINLSLHSAFLSCVATRKSRKRRNPSFFFEALSCRPSRLIPSSASPRLPSSTRAAPEPLLSSDRRPAPTTCSVDISKNQTTAAMACANWLHSSVLFHASCSSTSLRRDALSSSFRPATSSDGRSIFSSSYQYRPPAIAVQAQAKRGFSLKKEEETASAADMHFEAPLKIVLYPDPILRAKNKLVDTFDDNLKKLVEEMFDVMYKTDGIGLSAPQVGINIQLMVFNPVGERGEGEEIVLVNPRVTRYSKKLAPFTEGCLSFPGINADVVRPEAVKVDAQDITGEKFSVSLSGLPARVFQHEFDHLEGVLFFDRMSAEILDNIRTQLQELEQKYEDRTGLASPEKIETRKRWKAAAGFGRS